MNCWRKTLPSVITLDFITTTSREKRVPITQLIMNRAITILTHHQPHRQDCTYQFRRFCWRKARLLTTRRYSQHYWRQLAHQRNASESALTCMYVCIYVWISDWERIQNKTSRSLNNLRIAHTPAWIPAHPPSAAVRTSDRTPTTLTEVVHDFTQSVRANFSIVHRLDQKLPSQHVLLQQSSYHSLL